MSEGPLRLLPSLTHPSCTLLSGSTALFLASEGVIPESLALRSPAHVFLPCPKDALPRRGHPLAGRVPTPAAPMGSQVYQLILGLGRLAGEQAGRGAGWGRVWLGLLGGGRYIFQLRWCLLQVPRLSPSRGQNTDMFLMARRMSGPPGGCH